MMSNPNRRVTQGQFSFLPGGFLPTGALVYHNVSFGYDIEPINTRIDIGIKLGNVPPEGKLEAAGTWNGMVSHRVRITKVEDFDLAVKGPMLAVGAPASVPPWHALAYAPLAHVAGRYRAAGAEVINLPFD